LQLKETKKLKVKQKKRTKMKKIVLAIAAALMMSTAVMAQDGQNRERRQMNPEEMTQRRTEMMVQQYNLNETQAKQLLELNKEYQGKMGFGFGGPREQRPGMRNGNRGQRPEGNDTIQRRPRPQQGQGNGERPRFNMEEMQKTMQEYDAKLQKIMTEEQYKTYKANQEKMRNGFGRGQGQRQRRNN
jgi:Spy/CpxP family protein refolding chaperone